MKQPEPSPLDQVADTLVAMAEAVRVLSARAKEETPALLKVEEVARRLAIDPSTVYRLIKEKDLRGCRVAEGSVRVAEADLARFIKQRTEVHA